MAGENASGSKPRCGGGLALCTLAVAALAALVLVLPDGISAVSRFGWGVAIVCILLWIRAAALGKKANGERAEAVKELLATQEKLEEREQELRTSEAIFASFVQSLPHHIFRKDNDGRFVFVNERFCKFHGKSAGEILGKTETELFPKELAAKYRRDDLLVRQSESNLDLIEAVDGPDGARQYVHVLKSPVYDGRGKVIGVQGVFWEVTERKRAEERLAEEKERLAVTLRAIGDGVISTDLHGRVTLLNCVAEELTGWSQSEAIGRHISDVFKSLESKSRQPLACRIKAALETGRRQETAQRSILVARAGKEFLIEDRAAAMRDRQRQVIGAVLVFQDISARAALEAEAAKSSRIESIGLLAGGIAHDFNNILTTVIGNLSLAKIVEELSPELSRRLDLVEKAALRARDLTHQLLTFAKGGAPVKQAASLIEIIRESADFALRGSKVSVEFELAPNLAAAEIDPGQIHQVIHNLVLNAVQAMSEGGEIVITALNHKIEPGTQLPLAPGNYVMVSVQDDGPGISAELLPKIFDPYFTTKPGGNGLGLATAFSVLKRHEGYLTVHSKVGHGTTFAMYLPASRQAVAPAAAATASELRGAGRVLVMDDEESVRDLACSILRHFGYEPEPVSDGTEAIVKYALALREGEPFSAVVMDLTIPGGMGGREALQQLRAIDRDIRAIVSSGYSNDPVMARHQEHGFVGVIAKPYRMEDFGRVLRQAIESPGPAALPN